MSNDLTTLAQTVASGQAVVTVAVIWVLPAAVIAPRRVTFVTFLNVVDLAISRRPIGTVVPVLMAQVPIQKPTIHVVQAAAIVLSNQVMPPTFGSDSRS
ncbi:hypothetical protein C5Y93_09950 [Blastopirellula marina]|uniref:Uncharacterized protein n=1 Tax=Blastopirellula marina TaxID=124 RepID=A0A2S8GPE7_9BACT|nr:hypothetical protein C5Y93_09950 [Blastopirellula marina]